MMKKITNLLAIVAIITLNFGLQTSNCFAQVIAGGYYHSLFVCSNGDVWSCGLNNTGELGDGSTIDKSTPVQVTSLSGITAVSAGNGHSIFLKNDSTVWACGWNGYGELGDGTTVDESTPVQVSGLTAITAIAATTGIHSLFLKKDGTVWACGKNDYGQLGIGTIDNNPHPTPVQISSLSGITAIATGGNHSFFLKSNGTVWTCGYNGYGQLGDGTGVNQSIPVQVSSLTGIIAMAGGMNHSLFLKNNNSVWTCGANAAGQLGDGTTTDRATPVQVTSLSGIIGIAGGQNHSLFLKNNGTVWACGYNGYGQLADGTTVDKSTPVQASSLGGITAIAAGHFHSLFLQSGTVWTCGENNYGQLGDATLVDKSSPVKISIGSCGVLPIQLLSFTGKNEGDKNILEWATASEINNDYFTIQRKNESESESEWEEIGKVNDAGNSNITNKYEFTDQSPLSFWRGVGGEVYYRLKQVDYNGSFTYSNIISVVINEGKHSFNAYPIPASDELSYEFIAEEQGITIIIISDVLGNILMKKEIDKIKGKNHYTFNINSLPKGIYFLKADNTQNKFIKE